LASVIERLADGCCPELDTTKVCVLGTPTVTPPNAAELLAAGASASAAAEIPLPPSAATTVPPGVATTFKLAVLLLPTVLGANDTTTVQDAFAASVPVHVLRLVEMTKSAWFVPERVAARPVVVPAVTPPLLRIVNDAVVGLVWLTTVSVNEADVGVIVSLGGASPVPVSPAEVESAGFVATICNVPLGAALVGAKSTPTVQLPGTPSVFVEQVSPMIWNSVEPTMLACRVPVGDAPVFITVNVTGVAAFAPCANEPKS